MARTHKIVDTNVCVVSNRPQGMPLQCVSNCARCLHEIVTKGILVMDTGGIVFAEYKRHLSFAGQPGPGDVFFKWMVDNRYRPDRVAQVALTPHAVREGEFAEFPDDPELEGFDRDDRVFVALALAHQSRPAIQNASDSDYWHHRDALAKHDVMVNHVCGHDHYKLQPVAGVCP